MGTVFEKVLEMVSVMVVQQCVFNATVLYIQKWQIVCISYYYTYTYIYTYVIVYICTHTYTYTHISPKNQARIHERLSQRHADHSIVQMLQVRSLTSYRLT